MILSWKKLLRYIAVKGTEFRRDRILNLLSNNNIYFKLLNGRLNTTDIIIPSKSLNKSIILLTAHYDVVPNSFGYNDNGCSIICLLKMINKLPDNVEILFTDKEECGGGGVDLYLKDCKKNIKCVINLDVIGLKGIIYADNNINGIQKCLIDCKKGKMPFNDGDVFREYKIPTITLSVSSKNKSFEDGIKEIMETIHNNKFDNNINIICVFSIEMIMKKVFNIINMINNIC